MRPRTIARALVLVGILAGLRVPGATSKPNVIMVLTDDQGYGDMSCHGNPILRTPNLDRLHSESVRLTDFHVAPMCTPSRGQLMSGQDALRNGAMCVSSGRTFLRRGLPTMAEVFRASGYRTGIFGKWHLGDNYPHRPQDRGFEESVYFPSSAISSAPDYWNNDYFDDVYRHNGVPKQYRGYCTDVFFAEAIRWIRSSAARSEPFFAYVPTNAPRWPLYVPKRYRELYKNRPRNEASFFGMIANIDENMGKLDTVLGELGLRENTVLIFTTDNGTTVGADVWNAGMRGRKRDLYDGGHRVPFFIRWPAGNLRPPGDVAELTEGQDVLPTLIDLLGLREPSGVKFDGISLAPLLRGQVARLPDRILVVQFSRSTAPAPQKGDAAVLWRRWRLVCDKHLHNLEIDPGQAKDVADEHPEIVAKMRLHYETWWSSIAPRVNELGRISVGSDAENPTMLSTADWQDVALDHSSRIRTGEAKNGTWGILVERAGDYEIELRRWPVEADAPIAANLPPYKAADAEVPAGAALPVTKARLKVGDFDQSRTFAPRDKAVWFGVHLATGHTELRTWFYDSAGNELCGAYYVNVRRR